MADKTDLKLDLGQLKDIAESLQDKITEGLSTDGSDLLCLPTYIKPNAAGVEGKAMVLDLGGTNYRVAVVELATGKQPVIHPRNGWKKDLSVIKTPGFTRAQLFREQADPIAEIRLDSPMPIGYCFSYPADSTKDGDAVLCRWTKAVDIREMIGEPVGKPLLDYLNREAEVKFTGIKVINDTVASLFAGVSKPGYDTYIGLIVGTGTNMAPFINADNIPKLDDDNIEGYLPVNLESGNFHPPHLTCYDEAIDARSINKGQQRFEKAISGMYLGELLREMFPGTEFGETCDASTLTAMMSYPDIYRPEYVDAARAIYKRSADLVAASLAGMIRVLRSHDHSVKRILLTAEGGLYWSGVRNWKSYHELVMETLRTLLAEYGMSEVTVDVNKMDNANLIGTAVAALS